eukprot:5855064-Pleurochrysis_carterae.AAC.1
MAFSSRKQNISQFEKQNIAYKAAVGSDLPKNAFQTPIFRSPAIAAFAHSAPYGAHSINTRRVTRRVTQ